MSTTQHAGRTRPVPPAAPDRRTWAAIVSLALGAAIIVTTEFLPVGFLPDVASDLHVSLGVAGLMVLVPGLSAGLSAPLAIVAAGAIDRRRVILGLGALVVASNALAAVAPSFAVVLAARVFLGVAIGGFWGVVPPLGFRLAGPVHGARATSVVLSGLSAGTVIGLPAGQLLGHLIGWRWTFAAGAAIAMAATAFQSAVLPSLAAGARMRFGTLADVLRIPAARVGLITGGIVTIGQFSASTFVTPLLRDRAHMGSTLTTIVLLGYGLAGIAGTLGGARLVARHRIATLIGASAAVGAAIAVLPLLTGTDVLVATGLVVWGGLWGLVPLALQTQMLVAVPEAQEAGSAVFMTIAQLAIAGGAALGGVLVDAAGLATTFFIGGAVAASAAAIAAALTRHA